MVHQRADESLPKMDSLVSLMCYDLSDLESHDPDQDHSNGTHPKFFTIVFFSTGSLTV